MLLAGWLTLLLATVSGCKSPATSAVTSPPVVKVAEAKRGSIAFTVQLSGRFQPMDIVTVPARTSGRIDEIFVKIGDRVHRGDLLAVLLNIA
jgi:multidrug efflux pump subunit AcrA (membrane-fusion protein)